MPTTYAQLLFHVVFSTKHRQRTLPDGPQDLLYQRGAWHTYGT
jgi:hypothetical protein